MFKTVDSLKVVKGVSIYRMKDGIPDKFPVIVDNATVTLPQITHPTYTTQAMGDTDLPDQTRVNSMTTQIECELSALQSTLLGYGVQGYMLRWAQEMETEDGAFKIVPFVAYIEGIPAEDVGASVKVGENTTGTLSINTLKYRLVYGDDGQELRYVDKRAGVLRINGVDYRADVNRYL